jgi:hypothetical protein
MATQVENPFDTQQPNPTNQNIQGGTQPMNTGSASATGFQQFNPTPNVQPQTFTAQTSQVNAPTETMQGQVDSILSRDNPLMQRARSLATQQMNQRGLVNSSMSQGAGVAAMVDRALPIAQQDAQTYNQRALANQEATNQANQFNVGQTNQMFQFGQDLAGRFGMQREQQQFQAGQTALDRGFQAEQNQFQRDFQQQISALEQSGLDFRQARDIASREMLTRLEQAGINNRFDQELALRSEQFNAEQINLERRQIADNAAQLERLNLSINAQNQNIPTSFAASISNTTMAGVNAVMSDPNMNAAAKQTAINNLVNYANAQIGWAEKFYNTAIPRIGSATVS